MLDREPFLQAIFAAPDDDLPRLVFADWLDEHGEPAWAELIRVQCELARTPDEAALELRCRAASLIEQLYPETTGTHGHRFSRGFLEHVDIFVTTEELTDPEAFRLRAVTRYPGWYGATRLTVTEGPIVTPKPLVTILTSPVTERVAELDLRGREEEVPVDPDTPDESAGFRLIDFNRYPTISTAMVEELAGMRECRRLSVLDLRNNDLGNDALRALAESPYLIRVTKLLLFEGNRFKGRPWQKVLERCGESVVEQLFSPAESP